MASKVEIIMFFIEILKISMSCLTLKKPYWPIYRPLHISVIWLCNQHYYTRDAIGIEMTHRDLPYCKGIRAKT